MTAAALADTGQSAAVSVTCERAVRILLACQDQAGWWPDRATGEVSFAAEALLAQRFQRAGVAPDQDAIARLIRSGQRADGSWAGAEPGATADLSASVLSYLALSLTGDSPDAFHMAEAAGWIRDAGGIEAAGVTARAWLALFGLTAWADVPVPFPEAVWASARDTQTSSRVVAVTLAILGAMQPGLAPVLDLAELRVSEGRAAAAESPRPASAVSAARSAARAAALQRCVGWLAAWQRHSGDAGGLRPAWPLSLVALQLTGCPVGDRPAAGCLPPVAQTALAVGALRAAGMPVHHPSIAAAARWLLERRTEALAFGAGARGGPVPTGWSFCPDGYPRPADTAIVLSALSGIEPAVSPVISGPARWLASTQDQDGGWGGSALQAGHCVRALAAFGAGDPAVARAIRRGVVRLLRAQRPTGAWSGRAAASDLLATSIVLPALRSAGVRPGKPCITGGAGWLLRQQNADGGWHLGGVAGPAGAGNSDVAGTSLVLSALLGARATAGGRGTTGGGAEAAANWLIGAQLADGSWARSPDGILLPLTALGQYVAAR